MLAMCRVTYVTISPTRLLELVLLSCTSTEIRTSLWLLKITKCAVHYELRKPNIVRKTSKLSFHSYTYLEN